MTSRLLTTYFPEPKKFRRCELDQSIALNAMVFDQVCIISENAFCPGAEGVEWKVIDRRQTYDDAIAWANELAADDDVSIVANCDIFLPLESILQIEQALRPNEVFCLTRYEIGHGGVPKLYDTDASQDVWTWRGKLKGVTHGDFFGVPGCENRFAHRLQQAGYKVLNPSRTIKTFHFHNSMIRSQSNSPRNRLPPPYLFISPHALGEEPELRPITEDAQFHAELIKGREIRRSHRLKQMQESH